MGTTSKTMLGLEYLRKTQPEVFDSLHWIQQQLELNYKDMQVPSCLTR